VWIAVPFGFITVFSLDYQTGATAEWGWTTVSLALFGSILGAILGIVFEKQSASKYAEGSWERAREAAIQTFKERIERYDWVLERLQIDSYEYGKGKGVLVLTIVQLRRGGLSQIYWPIKRYLLTITRMGEIIEMKSIPIKDDEK
jgi:hypothetical protein